MPAVTRELSITYGSTTIGGTSDTNLLHLPITVSEGPDTAQVTFRFVFRASSEALFDSGIASLESEFRTPRQNLVITQGSATLYSFSHTVSTGFNSIPRISKRGDDIFDTGRSRMYDVTIDFDMPADTYAGQAFRRDSSVTLNRTPSNVRTLDVQGVYTANGGTSSFDQFEAEIDAYLLTLTTGFGGTWETVTGPEATHDDTNKICQFSASLQELVYNQALGKLDDDDITDQQLVITPMIPAPGDTGTKAKRFFEVGVSYSASIRSDTGSFDASGRSLQTKYENTIRPYLIDQALARTNQSRGALVMEAPEFDGKNQTVSCTMEFLVPRGSDLIEFTETIETFTQFGKTSVPVWKNNPFARHIFDGPQSQIKTTTQVSRVLGKVVGGGGRLKGGGPNPAAAARGGGGLAAAGGTSVFRASKQPFKPNQPDNPCNAQGDFFLVSDRCVAIPLVLGSPGNQLNITDLTRVIIEERGEQVFIPGRKKISSTSEVPAG